MIRELLRYRSFIKNLILKDLKLKYRDSVLGVVWSLLHPLLMLSVYTFAFRYVMRIEMEDYPYFLLVGLLPWNFFSSSVLASTGAIIGNGNLIRKVYFPREILPITTVLFCFIQFLIALTVFVPLLAFASGVTLRWTAVLFFPILFIHVLFTIGIAFILAALTTAFRDVAHLSEVAVFLLFWVTPIIYPVGMAPEGLQLFFRGSPLAAFAIAYQDVLFWGRPPDAMVLGSLVAWTVILLTLGRLVFSWYETSFAESV